MNHAAAQGIFVKLQVAPCRGKKCTSLIPPLLTTFDQVPHLVSLHIPHAFTGVSTHSRGVDTTIASEFPSVSNSEIVHSDRKVAFA